jgi:DNA polymerase-3 subunit gamma/tau
VEVEAEAIEILARRAAGSMRDSQSLLEQLLAFGGERITVADVHAMLGTAAEGRLGQIVGPMVKRDAAACLAALDAALAEGVDVGQLLDQLLGYFRDVMAACVGCPPEMFLHVSRSEQQAVQDASQQLGLTTVLAAMQILDQTLARLRYSTARRTLAELALARICALEDLEAIAESLAQLRSGGATTSAAQSSSPARATAEPPAKKKSAEIEVGDSPRELKTRAGSNGSYHSPNEARETRSPTPLTEETAQPLWQQVLKEMGDLLADAAAQADRLAISGPNRLVVSFPAKYTSCKEFCEHPERTPQLEAALSRAVGSAVRLEFRVDPQPATVPAEPTLPRPVSQRARLAEKAQNPLVRRAEELFEATAVAIDES